LPESIDLGLFDNSDCMLGAGTMKNIESIFQRDIEVERMWVAVEQGRFILLTIFPLVLILMYLLWDSTSREMLILWVLVFTAINIFRWLTLHFYHRNKEALIADVSKFKFIIMASSSLVGFWCGMGIFWIVDPSEPYNLMVICVFYIILCVGAIMAWFCYFPAVMAEMFLPGGPLSALLFLSGDKNNMAISLIIVLLIIVGMSNTKRLARMLDYALHLNFENALIRKEFEEKSLLLETALENMEQGISMSDKNDQLRMWNKQFTNLVGTAGEKVSTNADLSSILMAANPPFKIPSQGWLEYRSLNGQVYEVRQSKIEQGGRVITYTNISDLIKREQALEKARKDAEQANAAKTRFLAAASHDLRQPIHALGLFFAALSDRVYTPETALVISQIDDSIAAISSMLNALLDVSKLDAGVVKPNIESFELTELFSRLQVEFQPIAIEKHNELHIRPTSTTVNTDPSMLDRILRNLIGNAIRYTKNGRILVAARPRGQNIEIRVMDTGSGIPEHQLEEIFVEFHQLQNPARDRRQGLGLGLSIVKRLAKLLHHPIKVSSRLGVGSCFSITLPSVQVTAETKTDQSNVITVNPSYSLESCQLLVLDDDPNILEGMNTLLTRWGCQVISASTPDEANEKLARNTQRLDVLIIDYRLADNVSGITAAKDLQNQLGYAVSVLIITGDTAPERLREADTSGFPLLHKPVQPAKLRSAIQHLVSN